jgi:hypothetical protein
VPSEGGAQAAHERLQIRHGIPAAIAGGVDGGDGGAAHHHAVGERRHLADVVGVLDAEADGDGQSGPATARMAATWPCAPDRSTRCDP